MKNVTCIFLYLTLDGKILCYMYFFFYFVFDRIEQKMRTKKSN